MPFNGSGVFSRLENWTSDANNNLPISATKFDTESNDFATAFNNCLTRDGQGAPTSALTWAQTLTLNKGSDGTELTVGRTGGTNNPALAISLTDSGGVVKLNVFGTTAQLQLAAQGTTYVTLANNGALTANAPSGNAAIALTTATYTFGNATDNPAYTFSGSGVVTAPGVALTGSTVPANGIYLPSANTLGLSTNSASRISINSAGAVTFNAPTAGIGVSMTGFAGSYTALFQGAAGSGNSNGILLNAGTNSSDNAFLVRNQAAGASYFYIRGDGLVQATDDGGTLQTVGWRDAPQNIVGVNTTFALADRGKSYAPSANNIVFTIPANASVAFPIGTIIIVSTGLAGGCTVAITTDTLTWAGQGTTGTRTLSNHAVVTLYKHDSTHWYISGSGIS